MTDDAMWRWGTEKFIGICAKCGREKLKRNMATLLIRTGSMNPRTLCHICHDCLPILLDDLEVSMPD